MKYDYVVFTNSQDYWEYMFKDIADFDNIEIISSPLQYNGCSTLCQFLHRIHYNSRINKILELPYKSFWNKKYYTKSTEGKRKCFIFMMTWIKPFYEVFFQYLKSTYEDCMLVLYLEDIIASRASDAFDLDIVTRNFDKVITYDKGDAAKYGFFYYPTFISKFELPIDKRLEASDMFFCGAAKNRYSQIIRMFKDLKCQGYKVDCAIARMQAGEDRYCDEDITYIDYVWKYKTYLEHLQRCNCIIELMQPNATGFTLRTWEALVFNKKLITTNKAVINTEFYRPEQILVVDSFANSEIDKFMKKEVSPISEDIIHSLSPINFIRFIENEVL